tara:strand:+ start:785 stop:1990 length:1206 start_codon:yes stop_codon:yes gene_type:complete
MGLLDNTYLGSIFDDWKKSAQNIDFRPKDDFSGMDSDTSPALGQAVKASLTDRAGGSPLTQPGGAMFPTSIVPQNQGQLKVGGKTFNLPQSMLTPEAVKNQKKAIAEQKSKTPTLKQDPAYQDRIMTGGQGTQQADLGFMQRLASMTGVDFDKAAATWKDKGGFEGLMSNPAFTMGLAFMAAGAEGKSIGQSSFNSILKAGGISQQYKKIIADRKQAPIQATATDVAEVKSLLGTMNISDPSAIEKIIGKVKGENRQAMFDMAAEDIAIELQKEMQRLQNNRKTSKPLTFGTRDKLRILKKLIESGKIKKVGGTILTDATLRTDVEIPTRAMGGPIKAGKPYVVGEEGPEVVIPKSDGNVLTTDDSQIFAMLLAANPQLQKVSKQRAEKILRARFPEYFEG